ncbi:MAG: sulfatase/phosphatase domain-containing protein, partial [Candidatus Latescibacterota bacterium]|nr:sulfatase/phosphatase domain-containing protein [Candidatus Latescibacterota bacterium]
GDHGILGKTVLYEESVKVPLLIHAPELSSEQSKITGNVSHIDLVPTILDLLGEELPEHLQGISRTNILRGEDSLETNDVFIEWNGTDGHPRAGEAEVNPGMATPWRTVITADRWKLNLSNHDKCELYDLNSDPYEQTNRFQDLTVQDRVAELSARISDWQQSVDDSVPLPH